jgi:hypothetical protein
MVSTLAKYPFTTHVLRIKIPIGTKIEFHREIDQSGNRHFTPKIEFHREHYLIDQSEK